MKFSQKGFLVVLIILLLILYLLRLQSVSKLNLTENQVITLHGRITQQPYLKGSYQVISLNQISLKTDRFPGYFYGDKIEVTGKFQKKVINPFLTQYNAYLPAIRLINTEESLPQSTRLKRLLYRFRGHLEIKIAQLLPEPQLSLILGVLLGAKREMPEGFFKNLRDTGTLHIVVASGYNLSVVAAVLVNIFLWIFNRKKALIFALVGIFLYTLMIGAEPPVVRAAIMASLAFAAEYLGRPGQGIIGLFIAAAAMLIWSPLILFDISFQLSFGAMIGILLIQPHLRKVKFFRGKVVGDDLASTLSAQIGVMPIILANFGNLSWLSPLVNALLLPLIPVLMNLGAIMALFVLVSKHLGQLLAWLLWLPLTYFVKIIGLSGSLPWINWQIGPISFWWAMGYYVVVGLILLRFKKNESRRS